MTRKLRYLCTLLLMMVASGVWADTGTIVFGNKGTKINDTSVTGTDNLGNTWTITTVAQESSFTQQDDYSQVGAAKKPATSITFTTTLAEEKEIKSFSAKFGGFSGTGGTITLKNGDTTVGTGSLNATSDVTVSTNQAFTGKVLTVTVTNISKGVKCYSISYSYDGETIELTPAGLAYEETAFTVAPGASFTAPTLTNPYNLTVTYASSDADVASVNASTGAVTVGTKEGKATITASSEENDQYEAGEASYTITVKDPNGPGTETNPFTVEKAISFINTLGDNVLSDKEVYVSGIVSQVDHYVGDKYITYWISDDGTTTTQLEVYKGLGLNGAAFKAITDLGVGDKVTVCGKVKLYKNNSGSVIIPEFDADNKLVSFEGVTRIVADDVVTLEYDATSGEIAYTVQNQGSVSSFSVELEAGCDWISNINYATSPITFTTTENDGGADRSATITLHHTGAEDKVVTVTQKCNPNNVKMVIEEEDKITFSFNTNNKWDFPTDTKGIDEAEYTADGYTIKVAGSTGNGYKYDNNVKCLLLGKEGAYLSLPAFSFPVSKIEVEGNSGASGKVTQNIFVDDEAVSTETTGAAETNTYEISSDNQAAGTIYTLKVTNEYNTQITQIIVYKGEESGTISTGINNVEQTIGDAAIYNLNGVRVNKVQKGVYVVNGKKVVIK